MLPLQRLQDFIARHQLFNGKSRLLVAVSGGRDSVLLIHLLKRAGLDVGIAHCNFQLRGDESDFEQDFVAGLAKRLEAPFYTVNFDTANYADQRRISVQMAARELRYQWFEEIRESFDYDYIAVAHHQNDSVETILLNLIRGTGIAGMHGILPKNGFIVRPILFLSRDEVDGIVAAENLSYVEDSSNASVKYARNKLRHQVIPVLKELNPNLEQTFEGNMQRFRGLEELLKLQTQKLHDELFVEYAGDTLIPIEAIKTLRPQRLLLYGLLSDYGFSETAVDDIIASLDKHAGRTFESPGYLLVLDRTQLILTKRRRTKSASMLIEQGTREVNCGDYKLTLLHDDSPLIVRDNPMAASIDAELLSYPLTIRSWAEGDYFYPLGMKGRKKLSDFFVNEKLPVHVKDTVPVLVNGNGDVIWIGGYRADDRYKVTAYTKKVTIFELYKLNYER
ncbi:tRNA lysidine(34) synthetase TilS [Mucilaginibacter sp. PPCGB 2223]|uniref:tRNA lysidine(34) synthetase TilS n=1 Tax=Mucilaginibacter sp. PPCGB 2223 TaxID=1886027 RepID=UPI0008260CE2|nr:tRNA lysidine(34) synthetase TilS [Mucilaginibacter sp. PPCGB 2223]OCX52367.1 tRNA lysidine(34) synthetase TilS [Mucilaginibacter sp. PPCGB 2223]